MSDTSSKLQAVLLKLATNKVVFKEFVSVLEQIDNVLLNKVLSSSGEAGDLAKGQAIQHRKLLKLAKLALDR